MRVFGSCPLKSPTETQGWEDFCKKFRGGLPPAERGVECGNKKGKGIGESKLKCGQASGLTWIEESCPLRKEGSQEYIWRQA